MTGYRVLDQDGQSGAEKDTREAQDFSLKGHGGSAWGSASP